MHEKIGVKDLITGFPDQITWTHRGTPSLMPRSKRVIAPGHPATRHAPGETTRRRSSPARKTGSFTGRCGPSFSRARLGLATATPRGLLRWRTRYEAARWNQCLTEELTSEEHGQRLRDAHNPAFRWETPSLRKNWNAASVHACVPPSPADRKQRKYSHTCVRGAASRQQSVIG